MFTAGERLAGLYLSTVVWKANIVSDELGYVNEEISKQSVVGVA